MSLRYTIRTQPDNRLYCVWDNTNDRIARSAENRDCVDLSLNEAFDASNDLNIQDRAIEKE